MRLEIASAWLGAALFGAGVALAVAALHDHPGLVAALRRYTEEIERELRYQGEAWTGERVLRAQRTIGSMLITWAALSATVPPLVCAVVVAYAPRIVLSRRRRVRTERIEQQLDGFLIAVAHSLRATPALGDGLRSSADVIAPPLADELQLLLREHDLGTPLDRAFDSMAQRIRSPVVSAALSTLRVARSTGGDFVHTLERSAATLREMARLEGVVRTKTAEGRAQTVVVSMLPVPTLALIDHMSPKMLVPLWTTDAGHVVIAVAMFIWLISIVAARRIVHVDI